MPFKAFRSKTVPNCMLAIKCLVCFEGGQITERANPM